MTSSEKFLTDKSLQDAVDAAVLAAVALALAETDPTDGLWRPRDIGYKAASVDPATISSNQPALVSQTQYVTSMFMDQPGQIERVSWYRTTAGTSISEATVSLYDAAGVKLCEADVAATLAGAVNVDSIIFPAPSRAMELRERVYVVLRATFTGTAVAFRGPSTNSIPNAAGKATGATTRYGTLGTGVTAAPATIDPSLIVPTTVGGPNIWMALQ